MCEHASQRRQSDTVSPQSLRYSIISRGELSQSGDLNCRLLENVEVNENWPFAIGNHAAFDSRWLGNSGSSLCDNHDGESLYYTLQ